MQLYNIFAGNSKKRMKHIATDELHKCEKYVFDRWHMKVQVGEIKGAKEWFQIVPAPKDAKIWRKTNSMSKMWKAQDNSDRGILPRSK
jgi:hypothetical protein